MASEAQIEANRRNAAKSTGPRTEQGKAASSRNAIRHGLAAAQLILFDERPEDFERFHDDLRTAYAPADAAEDELVERIAMASWRLRRVWRAEAAAMNEAALAIARRRARDAAKAAIAAALKENPPGGHELAPDELARVAASAAHALSNDELEAAMTPPEGEDGADVAEPGPADTLVWPDKLAAISRYEAALERALSRTTRELERSQALRRQMAIGAAKAAAEEVALKRRIAEAKVRMARERAANDPAAALTPFTLAALEAELEVAKRSQFPAPRRGNGAANIPMTTS